MGQVSITFEIMPEGLEVNLDEMKSNVEAKIGGFCKVEQTDIKPIAFGLKALMMNVVVEDVEGMMDKLEAEIGSVPGVQNAKVSAMTKI